MGAPEATIISAAVTGVVAIVAGIGSASLTAWINRKNTTDTLALARLAADEQRRTEEKAWKREHLAAAYADAHRGIFALQAYLVSMYQFGPSDTEVIRSLGSTADGAISRLVFLADVDVTEAAMASRLLCRKLHHIAEDRVENVDPTAKERWQAMNSEYVESMKKFTRLASRSLQETPVVT